MKIIGIDPGTARMGYSIVLAKKNGEHRVIETNVLITPPEMEMQKRLKSLYLGIHEILGRHKPNVMVIEKLFFNSNAKTAISVGQARGIAMLAAADYDLGLFEYTALEAKRILTGYGRSTEEMQQAVKDVFKLANIVKSDDANDAIAIVLCHLKKSALKND